MGSAVTTGFMDLDTLLGGLKRGDLVVVAARPSLGKTSLVLNFARKVKGELDPADVPEVLTLIRKTMGQQGEAEEIMGSLEWSSKGEAGERYVTLSSKDGTTSITSSANLTQLAIVSYLPAGIVGAIVSLVGFLTSANAGNPLMMILSLLAIPAVLTVIRILLGKVGASESAKLQKVVDDLARLVGNPGDCGREGHPLPTQPDVGLQD